MWSGDSELALTRVQVVITEIRDGCGTVERLLPLGRLTILFNGKP